MGRLRRCVRWVVRGRAAGLRARLSARLRRAWAGATHHDPPPAPPVSTVEREPALPGSDVCDVAALAPGQIAEFVVDGVPVAVANVDGAFFAVSNVCPHAGGPIGDGALEGYVVACPLHGWRFDVRTGACDVAPSARLEVYAARAVAGRVRVDVPARPRDPEVAPGV